MNIRPLDEDDRRYALFAWREGAKKAPEHDKVPWAYYKDVVVPRFAQLLDECRVLGAYDAHELRGWLAMSPGKRVHTVHWVHVKHTLGDGARGRRQGVMTALLDAAELGQRFIYTLHARKLTPSERAPGIKTLDEVLVAALRARGVTATLVPLKEWLQ